MGTKFNCTNNNCNYPGDTRFEMTLNQETIMDNNNVAAIFCPFCKKEMVSSVAKSTPNDGLDTPAVQPLQ